MSDIRIVDIAIPSWRRSDMTIESFAKVHDDERVGSITIVDDASDDGSYEKLEVLCLDFSKVRLYRNSVNLDCFRNKHRAIQLSGGYWVALIDSDNIIDKDYLDALFAIPDWDVNTSYMPYWAYPTFNYEKYSGMTISKENIARYMGMPLFDTMLNCFNFVINRDEFLQVWDGSIEPHTADSLWFNYCWFAAGNKMKVVGGMQYFHRIHGGSHYVQNVGKTGNLYAEIEQKIRELK